MLLLLVLFYIIIAVSWYGWGCAISRRAPELRTSFGLKIVWGLALFLVAAGFVQFTEQSDAALFYLAFHLAGLIWSWKPLCRSFPQLKTIGRSNVALFAFLAINAVVLMSFLSSMTFLNCFDDLLAYIPFIKMNLARGEVIDPFDLRRLAGFGGQTALLSLQGALFNESSLPKFECLFLNILFLVILFDERILGPEMHWSKKLLFAFIIIWLPKSRINLAAQFSGAILFFGFAETLRLTFSDNRPVRNLELGVAAVVGAALLSLRANYLVGIGGFCAFYLSLKCGVSKKTIRAGALIVAGAIILTIPYAIGLHKSSETFFFPFWSGTLNAAFGTITSNSGYNQNLFAVLAMALKKSDFLFVIVMLLNLRAIRGRYAEYAALFGTGLLSMVAIAISFRAIESWADVLRYSYPFLIVPELLLLRDQTAAVSIVRGRSVAGLINWGVALVIFVYFANAAFAIYDYALPLHTEYKAGSVGFNDFLGYRDLFQRDRNEYAQIQEKLPATTDPILLAVDRPFLFDYSRHRFEQLDIPGNAAPGGHFPSWDQTAEVDSFLKSAGIKYFVFVDPDKSVCMYSRGFWESIAQQKQKRYHEGEWISRFRQYFQYTTGKIETGQATKIGPNVYMTEFK